MLKEKCEELEDALRVVNDEKDAAQHRNRREVNAAGAYNVEGREYEHHHNSLALKR